MFLSLERKLKEVNQVLGAMMPNWIVWCTCSGWCNYLVQLSYSISDLIEFLVFAALVCFLLVTWRLNCYCSLGRRFLVLCFTPVLCFSVLSEVIKYEGVIRYGPCTSPAFALLTLHTVGRFLRRETYCVLLCLKNNLVGNILLLFWLS